MKSSESLREAWSTPAPGAAADRRNARFAGGRIPAALAALSLFAGAATAAAEPLDSDAISDVAEATVTSVVNIASERTVELGPASTDPLFTDPRSPFYLDPDEQKQKSLGSGVIVTKGGRILTNAHVVSGAEMVKVTLSDGTELDAKVVGTDRQSDLAVIQLEGDLPELRPMPLGESSTLRLGEVVLAVGNPFGVGQAVTMGIVSAKGRAALGMIDYEDFIQTDAAINPGNSGGALVDLDGKLVGINTAIVSRSGGYEGIGFAIPTDMALPIMKMLVEDGKVVRGYIGVMLQTLTRDLATKQKLSVKRGVLVSSVMEDGPAGKAGVAEGDVIVSVDGKAVDDVGKLRNHIAMKGADQTVELELVRGKDKKKLSIKTAALPDPDKPVVKPAKAKSKKKKAKPKQQ
jgi:Do/DeqQ family serine protease